MRVLTLVGGCHGPGDLFVARIATHCHCIASNERLVNADGLVLDSLRHLGFWLVKVVRSR